MQIICSECKNLNVKSQCVSIFSGTLSTGQPNSYIDEIGINHYHGGNVYVDVYRCSYGHDFKHIKHAICGNCNWKSGESKLIPIDDDFIKEFGF